MYIKNGNYEYKCNDVNIDNKNNSVLFYLDESPILDTDEIYLYSDDGFLMKTIIRSKYKYETISEFDIEFILSLSNENEEVITVNIEEVKSQKIKEIYNQTQENISEGFNLDINGEIKHFSLETHDQQNIITICQYLVQHEEINEYLYHADGEPLQFYSRQDMFTIRDKMLEIILNNVKKYQAIKNTINTLETIEEINQLSL